MKATSIPITVVAVLHWHYSKSRLSPHKKPNQDEQKTKGWPIPQNINKTTNELRNEGIYKG